MKKIFTLLFVLVSFFSSYAQDVAYESQSITIYLESSDYDFKNKKSTLTKNNDGSWTIAGFIGSGQPFSFKFDTPEEGAYAPVTITSRKYAMPGYETYQYLLDTDGNYMVCSATDSDTGDKITIEYPCVLETDRYLRAYHYPAGSQYDYYISMYLYGYDEDEQLTITVDFWFDEPEVLGIADVISDNNAPVEYYNLSGIRVENPSNGIFIRKQGSEAKKVVVK